MIVWQTSNAAASHRRSRSTQKEREALALGYVPARIGELLDSLIERAFSIAASPAPEPLLEGASARWVSAAAARPRLR